MDNIDLIVAAGKNGNAILMMLPKDLVNRVIAWGKANIPDEYLFTQPNKGRELSPHITLATGIMDESPDCAMGILAEQAPFEVDLGNIGVFRKHEKGYDVIKVEVMSSVLGDLNKSLLQDVELQDPIVPYIPHITVAYVLPNSCDKLIGSEDLKGKTLVDSYVYANRHNGGKTVKLKEQAPLKESLDYGSPDVNERMYAMQAVESYLLNNKLSIRAMSAVDVAKIIIAMDYKDI